MGNTRQATVDPDATATPPGWATARPSEWSAVRDSVATLPRTGPGSGMRGAWAAGRELGMARAANGQPGASEDSGYGNGDSGGEDDAPASKSDVQGLHSRFDDLAGSIGNLNNSSQNANTQQMTPRSMPPREAPVNPLAVSAQKRANASVQMRASQQMLKDQAGRRNAIWNGRQQASSAGMAAPGGTGNGMSERQSSASMAGILRGSPMRPSSGVGTSAEQFENSRFAQ